MLEKAVLFIYLFNLFFTSATVILVRCSFSRKTLIWFLIRNYEHKNKKVISALTFLILPVLLWQVSILFVSNWKACCDRVVALFALLAPSHCLNVTCLGFVKAQGCKQPMKNCHLQIPRGKSLLQQTGWEDGQPNVKEEVFKDTIVLPASHTKFCVFCLPGTYPFSSRAHTMRTCFQQEGQATSWVTGQNR